MRFGRLARGVTTGRSRKVRARRVRSEVTPFPMISLWVKPAKPAEKAEDKTGESKAKRGKTDSKKEAPKAEAAKTDTAKPGAKAAAPTAAEKKARSAISIECSKQADEKKLHGKERKKFRSECRKAAAEKTT